MKQIYAILSLIFILALPEKTFAFSTGAYATESALAQGRWVKISVESDGLYILTNSRLRSMGFSDPSKVVVRGYGGKRLNDVLTESTYIDDLPVVPSELTDRGIVFYGVGAAQKTESAQGGFYYYRQNDYSQAGYYFVGVAPDGTVRPEIETVSMPLKGEPSETFMDVVQHERELVLVPGEAGPLLLGEDFRFTRTRSFSFDLTDAVAGGKAWFQSSFMSNLTEESGRLSFTIDKESVPHNTTFILPRTSGEHVYGSVSQGRHIFTMPEQSASRIEIGISLQSSSQPKSAYLNYLALNYERHLRIPASGYLCFSTSNRDLRLDSRGSTPVIWDVTDPLKIKNIDCTDAMSDGKAGWTQSSGRMRLYAARIPDARLPEPKTVGTVQNQNLHAISDADMIIVAPAAYTSDAQRLADMHAASIDSMRVAIATPEAIYNEFSSGAIDPGAIRRFFKMLYDRGNVSGRPLRYAILMARTTLDNRRLSSAAPTYPTIPSWMPVQEAAAVSDNSGYVTDDYMAMLEDGSGRSPGLDKLSIAIGRIPVTDTKESREVVDKILQYSASSIRTGWKQRFMFLADDGNNGVHLQDSEHIVRSLAGSNPYFVNKVYMDAYELIGSEYPEARRDMFRYLEEGVVWWNFIGHASTTGWTHEHQLSYTDLNNMYLRHWPFIYAATCDFLRLDGSSVSGGEILFKERYGGAIGMMSAVRPVFIAKNTILSDAIGRALRLRDNRGLLLPPGEICRRAKNDMRGRDPNNPDIPTEICSDDNRLRYVFVGDPALRLAMPSNIVRVDSINGTALADNGQPTIAALEKGIITGTVTSPLGEVLTGFNGILMADIFDAEYSITTRANGDEGKEDTFETHGERIYTGSAVIKDGRFTLEVSMPMEISQNFRPASLALYAYDTSDDTEATGLCNDFYVYGFDEPETPDTKAPVIETLVLNHEDFRNGDRVNTSPMLIASVSDDTGINVSNAGIGHQMVAILDGRQTLTGISNYYTPAPDGSPSGTINYPIDGLQPGAHSLTFRVWDTSGNAAEKSIDFAVAETIAPKIYDIYSDANPASVSANFYLRHNQPDNMVTVTVTVYNMLGRPLWSQTVSGRSDMFLTMPVTWDLTDDSGNRVGRGIYLYRASITSDGISYETGSRRIAVTAR